MKKLTLILLSFIWTILNHAQDTDLDWAKAIGGKEEDRVFEFDFDAEGNIYVAGSFGDTVDFDPGPDEHLLIAKNNPDNFILKLNSSGNFLWVKSFKAEHKYNEIKMSVDVNSNVYLSGTFYDTTIFDVGKDQVQLIADGESDIFVLKLNKSGNGVWVKQFNAKLDDVTSVAATSSGSVYLTGYFKEIDCDPGPERYDLISAGLTDAFVIKLNSAGNFVWAKKIGGTKSDKSSDIFVDDLGNVYATGICTGRIQFDSEKKPNVITNSLILNVFISKIDSNGNFIWAKTLVSNETSEGSLIRADKEGNVYISGRYRGELVSDTTAENSKLVSPGGLGNFILKLNKDGQSIWIKQFGGTYRNSISSMALDEQGNIYTTGYFAHDDTDFDLGLSEHKLKLGGWEDSYISKLDRDGNFIWVKSFEGIDSSIGNGIAIFIDNSNSIFTTGTFTSMIDFDSGDSTFNMKSTGWSNVYILKLQQSLGK